ncbi:MAG TPA: prepilin-type N-terminal cleavage/methylation domain-containing protein [Acidimicrobiales bacterium]
MTKSPARHSCQDHDRRSNRRGDAGFTLVELIIVVAITPMIIGAIAVGLIEILSLQGSVSNRLQNSTDTQVISSYLSKDVENSVSLTTNASSTSPSPCGAGTFTQLLGLEWGSGSDVVTYATVANGTTNTVNLVRNYCQSDALVSSNILAYNVSVGQGVPTVTCLAAYRSCVSSSPSASGTASSSWLTSADVQVVGFGVSEVTTSSATPYSFTLAAYPVQSLSTDPSALGGPSSSEECGYAVAGTGTYAAGQPQQLCFLDFGFLNDPTQYAAAETSAGLSVTEGVPGGYSISFNIKVSGALMVGHKFPSYQYAFLGNDVGTNNAPFYTGVGCGSVSATTVTGAATPSCIYPTVYEASASNGLTAYVTLSNFSVTSQSNGQPVTGFEVVSADAETTDANNEKIAWNVNSSGAPYLFHLIPNSPSSPIGNACNNLTASSGQIVNGVVPTTTSSTNDLTGMNLTTDVSTGQTVSCQSGFSTSIPRTGAAMLGFFPDASDPATLNVTLQGGGLEGMAVALLLAN